MFRAKAFVGALALGVSVLLVPAALGDDRPAADILADIDAVVMPTYDRERASEQGYRAEYSRLRNEATQLKTALIGELFTSHPDNERLAKLLPERWGALSRTDAEGVIAETDLVAARAVEGPLTVEAAFWKAQAAQTAYGWVDEPNYKKVASAIHGFVGKYPDDERGIRLLSSLAQYFSDSDKEALKIWKLLLKKYPDNRSAKYWPGKVKQADGLGKPFELEFTDAITGSEISMAQLRGKVVVIDFWATWCGPCIAEIPHLKELYATYKDQGVEFVGISLDQAEDKGGLEKLLKYCEENNLTWPQYYQGNYWSGEFSVSWGINSIPALFVVDQKGNLHSVKARGKLDEMLPQLLGLPTGEGG